jgi:hypothetical protein
MTASHPFNKCKANGCEDLRPNQTRADDDRAGRIGFQTVHE